jgi:hypothetical protein
MFLGVIFLFRKQFSMIIQSARRTGTAGSILNPKSREKRLEFRDSLYGN